MKFKYILKNNPLSVIVFLLFLIADVILFDTRTELGLIFLTATVIIASLWIIWNYKTVNRAVRGINSFMAANSPDNKNGLNKSPFPVAVTDISGNILWVNEAFSDITDDFTDFSGYNIKEIIHNDEENDSIFFSESSNRKFTVYSSVADDKFRIYYFTEDTYYKETDAAYKDSRPYVLLIHIDSLETSEDSLNHIDYISIVSDVERKVSQWLAAYNCSFRRTAEGKFFAITETVNFEKMKNDGFSILREVGEMNEKTEAEEITLTIGAGKSGNIHASECFAREALELGKGRGGDQAAVNTNGEFIFYGGKSTVKERPSKVIIKQLSKELDELIGKTETIYITGHKFSDFDSLGASIGIAAICSDAGKKVKIICNRETSLAGEMIAYYEKLPTHSTIVSPAQLRPESVRNSLLVICDTNREDLTEVSGILEYFHDIAVIDHHRLSPDNSVKAKLRIFDPQASSTCEMVTEIIEYSDLIHSVSKGVSTCILTGILLDTKNFSLRVGVRTFESAAFLKDKKADTVAARTMFAGTKEEKHEVSKVISGAEYTDDFAIAVYDTNNENSILIASKAADALLDVSGIKSSYVIYTQANGCKISARSLGDFNVQLVMEKLGGGGHAVMAACALPDLKTEEAKTKLLSSIYEIKKSL